MAEMGRFYYKIGKIQYLMLLINAILPCENWLAEEVQPFPSPRLLTLRLYGVPRFPVKFRLLESELEVFHSLFNF